jgi:hypothetical protein
VRTGAWQQSGDTAAQVLATRFTDGDEAKSMELIQEAQLMIAVKAGHLAEVRRLIEDGGMSVSDVSHHNTVELPFQAC